MALDIVRKSGKGNAFAPDSETVMACAQLILSDKTGEAATYFLKQITDRYTSLGLQDKEPVKKVLDNLKNLTANIVEAHATSGRIWGSQEATTPAEVNYARNLEELAKAGAESIGSEKPINVEFNFAINETAQLVRGYGLLGEAATAEAQVSEEASPGSGRTTQ